MLAVGDIGCVQVLVLVLVLVEAEGLEGVVLLLRY